MDVSIIFDWVISHIGKKVQIAQFIHEPSNKCWGRVYGTMIVMPKWLPLLNLVVFYYFLTYPSVGERSEIVETLFPPLLVKASHLYKYKKRLVLTLYNSTKLDAFAVQCPKKLKNGRWMNIGNLISRHVSHQDPTLYTVMIWFNSVFFVFETL